MITQILAPTDISTLGRGSVDLQLLEAFGYSADGNVLLVRATFTDTGDASSRLHYGMWTYDVLQQKYISCLNTLLTPGNANDLDVQYASIANDGVALKIVAQSLVRDSSTIDPKISTIVNGSIQTQDLITSLLGLGSSISIQSSKLSNDGRFLAIQTDSAALAGSILDTNECSDIYLVDLSNLAVNRVSTVGGSEVHNPVNLGNVYSANNVLQISFTTDSNFVSSQIDQNSAGNIDPLSGVKSDAYIWSSAFNQSGLVGDTSFKLVSKTITNIASGYVTDSSNVLLTSNGTFFNSASPSILNSDTNNSVDAFVQISNGSASRLYLNGIGELSAGASVISATNDGHHVLLLTSSPEVVGLSGLEELVLLDTVTGEWSIVSKNTTIANDIVISGLIGPNGSSIVFTSAADNLVPNPLAAPQGSLFIVSMNTAPVAQNDSSSVSEDATLTVTATNGVINSALALSGKDTDPDTGDTLTVTAVRTGTEAAGTGTTGAIASPLNGTYGALTLNADGSYSYIANNANSLGQGVTATDTFTYTISDRQDLADTAQLAITITGTNYGPVLSDTADPVAITESLDASAQNLAPITGSFALSDKDIGDTLTASVSDSPVVKLDGSIIDTGFPAGLIAEGVFTLAPLTQTSVGGTATAIGYTYDPSAVNLDFLRKDQSLTITYSVKVSDGNADSTQDVTFTITGTNDTPTGAVTIAGLAKQGQILTASNTLADLDGLGAISYQWQSNGVNIGGATGSTYTLTANEVGKTIDVVASYTDSGNVLESVASLATGTVIAADVNLVGTTGIDTLTGSSGNDTLNGGGGNDSLVGGLGDDIYYYAFDGQVTIDDAGGNDQLILSNVPESTFFNWNGSTLEIFDPAITGRKLSILNANGGGQVEQVSRDNQTLYISKDQNGSANSDLIVGLSGNDLINALEGNDLVIASLGNDTINGGAGNDYLNGNLGNDTLNGDAGNDSLNGGTGNDTIDGGDGIDWADYSYALDSVTVSLATGTSSGADGADVIFNIEAVFGSTYNDTLSGGAGNETLDGGDGNDSLFGGVGNDVLYGSAGEDTLSGGDGNDSLYGGTGKDNFYSGKGSNYIDGGVITDRLYYSDGNFVGYTFTNGNNAAVNINLSGITGDGSTGSGTVNNAYTIGGGTDTLVNINSVAGSNLADTILGSTALIQETFQGRGGNDTIDGGLITDTLTQENENRISYQNATGSVTVNLATGTAFGADGTDTLYNFNMVRGSAYNDTITGSDSLLTSDITEIFEGMAGNDTIDGAGGRDMVNYKFGATSAVNVNLATGIASDGQGGTDTLLNIEGVQGSIYDDVLTGGNAANGTSIWDYEDNKLEWFRGDAGNDTINGGQGYDRTDYQYSAAAVTVNLANGIASDGWGTNDVLLSIEGVRGSIYGDTLIGSDGAFESFEGREGNDTINGAGGEDRVDYKRSTAAVTVNLATGIAQDGYGNTDTLSNIEDIRGSRDFSDTLIGNDADNRLDGMAGTNSLSGGAGNDTYVVDYSGFTGFDTGIYNTISDVSGGSDTLEVTFNNLESISTGNYYANLRRTGVSGENLSGGIREGTHQIADQDIWFGKSVVVNQYQWDSIGQIYTTSIENLNLTLGVDYLTLNLTFGLGSNQTLINGSDGNDLLMSFGSGNTINGGSGDDILLGNRLDSQEELDLYNARNSFVGQNSVTLANVLSLAQAGMLLGDTLNGGSGNDNLNGYFGNDYLDGGSGADQMIGWEGNDIYIVDNVGDVVIENYTGGNFSDAGGIDTVQSSITYTLGSYIERLTLTGSNAINGNGNNLDNLIAGNAADNILVGGAGNDTLEGGGGNDNLNGGTGNDALYGGAGSDYLTGGSGNDTIDGGVLSAGQYTQDGNTVAYSSSTAGIDVNLQTGTAQDGLGGTDTLSNINSIVGSNYGDVITGSTRAVIEEIRGGLGDDTLDGGVISDTINQINQNTVSYANASGGVTVDLLGGTATGADGNDTLSNFNAIRGSSYADIFYGSDRNDGVTEWFDGRAGNDVIDGRGGIDVVRYDGSASGVNINLATGIANDGDHGTDTFVNIEGAFGSIYNDVLTGGNAANGTSVFDYQNDLIEFFRGNAGNDTIDGGQGYDRADYMTATVGVNVNLATGIALDGLGGIDTLISIEGVRGSAYNDTLVGSNGAFESFEGREGNDTIDGAGGEDRVDYYRSISGATIKLYAGFSLDGYGGTDTLFNIEDVRGTQFDDLIEGTSGNNVIDGSAGNDTLNAGVGDDTLLGGDGSDTIYGDAGNDSLNGGTGNDTIDGGDGIDWADYSYALDSVTVSLATGTSSGADGADVIFNIEAVFGSTYNDTLSGGAGNETLDGGDGNDSLFGGVGNDVLYGSAGEDTLSGGDGNDSLYGGTGKDNFYSGKGSNYIDGGVITDRLYYSDGNFVGYTFTNGNNAAVNINLSGITGDGSTGSGTVNNAYTIGGGTDTLVNINSVAGSNLADTILGSTALIQETFQGRGGNDTIDGGLITDTLTQENENRISYQNATGSVTVNLATGTAFGADGTDTLYNFNMVRGSAYNDTITGSDSLLTSDITEIFEGMAGNDTIDGAGGRDMVNYKFGATSAVNVNLATGIASDGQGGTDTLLNIEGVQGSIYDDVLTGGNAANGTSIWDYEDNKLEWFRGDAGNDTINGGQGYDRTDYQYSAAAVTVNLANGIASDGWGTNDVLLSIEGVRGSIYGDTLIGSDGAFESFEGREGNDTINGAGGEDRVDYKRSTAAVTVNLATGIAQDGYGNTDTLSNIEDIRGSRDFSDTLIGNDADNRLDGMGGNDTLEGGAGDDTAVYSGAKSDYLITHNLDGSWTVSDQISSRDGIDTLRDIENLQFSNQSYSLINQAPEAVADTANAVEAGGTSNGTPGSNATGNVLTNDTDVDSGDTKTVSAVAAGATPAVNNANVGNATAGTYGSLMLNSDGTYTYTIDNINRTVQALRTDSDTLTDTFTYTVKDTAGLTSSTTLTITVKGADDAPVAQNDSGSVSEDATLLVTASNGVINSALALGGKDTDPDTGDTLTVTAVRTGTEIAGSGTTGTIASALNGTYGALTLNAEGSYSYVANNANSLGQGVTATDTFTYTVSDSQGLTDTAQLTVTITGTNDAATGGVTIAGLAKQGQVLTASNTLADLDGLGIISYQWQANGINIGGATASTFTLTASEVGKTMGVVASYRDSGNVLESVASLATSTVIAGDVNLVGTAGIDTLTGGSGNDTLTGAGAVDRLNGAGGSDIYIMTASADHTAAEIADTGTGIADIDEVRFTLATASPTAALNILTLFAGDTGIERAVISDANGLATGTAALSINAAAVVNAITLIGNTGNNTLTGGASNDTLDGGAGNDSMAGGLGNDTYIVDSATDVVTEAAAAGTDTVQASVTYTLATNVENLTLTGNAAISGTGNTVANIITGNNAANVLTGAAGADTLNGGNGSDIYSVTLLADYAAGETINDTGTTVGDVDELRVGLAAAGTFTVLSTTTGIETIVIGTGTAAAAVITATTAINVDASALSTGVSITGNAGVNSLTGTSGNDTLVGGLGIDTFRVVAGTDTITDLGNGGAEILTIAAGSTANATVTAAWTATVATSNTGGTANINTAALAVNLAAVTAGTAGFKLTNTSATATTLTGSALNDALTGGAGADTLVGGLGNDSIIGSAGNDQITAGAGNDSVDGGEGSDIYFVALAADQTTADVIADSGLVGTDELRFSTAAASSLTLGSTTTGIETIVIGTGTAAAAVTTATTAINVDASALATGVSITGNAGANSLTGTSGNDTLVGGLGIDTFRVVAGTDIITDLGNGGAEILVLTGGTVNATVTAAWTATVATSNTNGTANINTAALAVNLAAVTAGNAGFKLTNTSATATTLTGSALADTLTGGTGNDTLSGGAGNDSILGGDGVDVMTGGTGIDILNGGNGSDIYSVTLLTDYAAGETINDTGTTVGNIDELRVGLAAAGTFTVLSTTTGIETIVIGTGTAAAAVTTATTAINVDASALATGVSITGNAGANSLTGTSGNDTLVGGLGIDTFRVVAGTDIITDLGNGGAEILVLTGGTVNATVTAAWTATVATSNTNGTANINTAALAVNLAAVTAGNAGFKLTNTSATATTLTGSALADTLTGGTGNDTLSGGAGNDSILGGDGVDVMTGGTGIDILNGGNGSDIYSVTLLTDYAAGETINDTGTTVGNIDELRVGLAAAGTFTVLSTTTGIETIVIGTGTAAAAVTTATTAINVDASALSTGVSMTGNAGANILTGTQGADTINGGTGNDTLIGGLGNDSLTGGTGIDSFTVASGTDTITDLGNGGAEILTISSGAAANATVTTAWTATVATSNTGGAANINTAALAVNLAAVTTGSAGFNVTNTSATATTLTGSALADTLTGGAGNDTLVGGLGNDTLTGGAGVDTFTVASGVDTITDLGNGVDVITVAAGSTANATLAAAWTAGATSINRGTENITTNGFATNLAAVVTAATNGFNVTNIGAATTLTGSSLNDTLTGGTGIDTISGGAGNDSIIGGDGADILTGGAGTDTLNGGNGSDLYSVTVLADYAAGETINDTGTTVGDVDELRVGLAAAGTFTVLATTTGIENIVIGTGTATAAVTTATTAINVSAAALTSAVSIIGNAGINILTGGSGADTLAGGLGNDNLTGGAGNDRFIFNSTTGATNIDTITDFTTVIDSIWLDKTIFTALAANTSGQAITTAQFWSGAGVVTGHDADDRVVYNTTNGALYYDADGNGAGAAVQIAIIGAPATHPLASSDIFVL